MVARIRRVLVSGIAALGFVCGSANAAVTLFQDDFETDSASSVLNFNAFNNWTVSDGTVDYIRSGGFGITCFGGAGGCVDLDGSTTNGGRMTSKQTFTILAAETYLLSLQFSGNQRTGPFDEFDFGLDGIGFISRFNIPAGQSFGEASFQFNGLSGLAPLFIQTGSNDNIGVIIDNVSLTCLTCGDGGTVPEPGSLALVGMTLLTAAAGVARTRAK